MIDAVVAPPGLHMKHGLLALCVAVKVADPPQIVAELTLTDGAGLTVTTAQFVTVAHAPVTSAQ